MEKEQGPAYSDSHSSSAYDIVPNIFSLIEEDEAAFKAIAFHKEPFIKALLTLIKKDMIFKDLMPRLKSILRTCKKYNIEYPELKSIEKSVGPISESAKKPVISVSSIREFALKAKTASKIMYKGEEWSRFDFHSGHHHEFYQWATFCNDPDLRYTPDQIIYISYNNGHPYHIILPDGGGNPIEEEILDPQEYLLDTLEISNLNKETVIPALLSLYRKAAEGSPEVDTDFVRKLVRVAREAGFDWPELKAIEKSVRK